MKHGEQGEWDVELCRLFGVPIACLPKIHPTVAAFGSVKGMPITAAVVDQQAALFGHGCRKLGDAKITFGTGAFALAVTGEDVVACAAKRSVANSGLVDRWPHDLCRRRRCLRCRLGGRVGPPHRARFRSRHRSRWIRSPARDRARHRFRAGAFGPCMSALGSHGRGSLSSECRPRQRGPIFCQALLERASRSAQADVVDPMDALVAIGTSIAIDGGLARSRYFAQFLADAIGRNVLSTDFGERTAFGAAALAAIGAGAVLPEPKVVSFVFEPRAGERAAARRHRFGEAVSRSKNWQY